MLTRCLLVRMRYICVLFGIKEKRECEIRKLNGVINILSQHLSYTALIYASALPSTFCSNWNNGKEITTDSQDREFCCQLRSCCNVDRIIEMFPTPYRVVYLSGNPLFVQEVKHRVQYCFLYLSTITIASLIP